MITKDERSGRESLERDLEQRQYGSPAQGVIAPSASGNEASNRGESPPRYDDMNYIPSPVNLSESLSTTSASGASEKWSLTTSSTFTATINQMYLKSPEVEADWSQALRELEQSMVALQNARSRAAQPEQINVEETAREVRILEKIVSGNMHRLALIHPDPRVQVEWQARADSFERTMSSFQPVESSSSFRIDSSDVDPNGEPHIDPARVNNDEIDVDKDQYRRGDGGSKFSRRARQLRERADKDKGMSYITKGTVRIIFLPLVVSGAIVYRSTALMYGIGKGAYHLGKKVTAASSLHSAKSAQGTASGSRIRSTSDPELVSLRGNFKLEKNAPKYHED